MEEADRVGATRPSSTSRARCIEKGHEVRLFGFRDNLDHLTAGLRAEPADVIFNLAEGFRGKSGLDYTVAAVLEMLGLPYTGASSEGLMLARDKALTKKVFAYQGIRIPHFMVCPRGAPCSGRATCAFR